MYTLYLKLLFFPREKNDDYEKKNDKISLERTFLNCLIKKMLNCMSFSGGGKLSPEVIRGGDNFGLRGGGGT